MLAELRIQRHTAEDTARIVDALVDVYARVYDVPPYRGIRSSQSERSVTGCWGRWR